MSERSDAGICCLLRGGGGRQLRKAFSHGLSFQIDPVSVVYEAVEDGVAEGGVGDDLVPMIDGQLGGDERRSVAMAVIEQLEQIVALLGGELGQPLRYPR